MNFDAAPVDASSVDQIRRLSDEAERLYRARSYEAVLIPLVGIALLFAVPAMLLFMLAQGVYLGRHVKPVEGAPDNPPELP